MTTGKTKLVKTNCGWKILLADFFNANVWHQFDANNWCQFWCQQLTSQKLWFLMYGWWSVDVNCWQYFDVNSTFLKNKISALCLLLIIYVCLRPCKLICLFPISWFFQRGAEEWLQHFFPKTFYQSIWGVGRKLFKTFLFTIKTRNIKFGILFFMIKYSRNTSLVWRSVKTIDKLRNALSARGNYVFSKWSIFTPQHVPVVTDIQNDVAGLKWNP